MRYHSCVLALVVFLQPWSVACADFYPIKSTPYRFLPARSVLHKTGGFAGVNERHRVWGTFVLETSQSPLTISPPIFTADFEKVDVHYGNRLIGDSTHIDEALNLTDIRGGTQYKGPPNVYRFLGKNEEGSVVRLWGAEIGPWFFLRGETEPPAEGADYFEYRIRALAHRTPWADTNDDGVIDGRDLAGLGAGAFLDWQQQLGLTPPTDVELDQALDAAIAAAGFSAATVPEPAGATLLAAALLAGATLRRRVRQIA